MIVLSLFDGMSCGQIALNQLGVKVDKYYASEIDKHAIKCTHLGCECSLTDNPVEYEQDGCIDHIAED